MQKSTLKKMAQTLGISISTASRALKDHPDISMTTRQRVKELAEAMEYEPNSYAVQLRTQKSNVLGVLVPSINNSFYDCFIATVEEEARKHGYSLLIMQSNDEVEIEIANLNFFRKGRILGLFTAITIATEDMTPFNKLEEQNIPIVFVDRVPGIEGYTQVCLADELAAKIAAEAIIKKNKKNVLALFGHPHLSISKVRKESFLNVFQKKSPKTKIQIDFTENSANSTIAAKKALQSVNPPDVIFCMGDLILIGVMKAIHELNLKIPTDVAVISISNGFIPLMYNPIITYVETSAQKLGILAFEHMMARIKNEVSTENVCVESKLVNGNSL